jgi:hypothetical protein
MDEPNDDLNAREDDLATEVVSFIDHLRELGFRPNRTVVFKAAAATGVEPGTCDGWLLEDTLFSDRSSRWLLLDDGNVWHEAVYETAEESYPECTWVDWRSEHLATVLTLTLTEVRRGRRGGLAQGDGSDRFHVLDRRRRREPGFEAERRRAD